MPRRDPTQRIVVLCGGPLGGTAETTMKEHPIIFAGPSIRAILEGRKTQTRRPIQFPQSFRTGLTPDDLEASGFWNCWQGGEGKPGTDYHHWQYGDEFISPNYQAGDRLWVKETWAYYPDGEHAIYKAREGNDLLELGCDLAGCWRSSRFMPRKFSRLLLELTEDPGPERVQDISEEDAWAEGLHRATDVLPLPCLVHLMEHMPVRAGDAIAEVPDTRPYAGNYAGSPKSAYEHLWEAVNNPGGYCAEDNPRSWDANPWVWRITFKILEGTAAMRPPK